MKTMSKLSVALLALVMVFSVSCEKTNDTVQSDETAELPPFETMAVDFSDFLDNSSSNKAALNANKPGTNWLYPRIVVGFWNTALFTTLAVPVASFKGAFAHEAEVIADNKWQWAYSVDGFASAYTARLTGELTNGVVVWEMYVTKAGVGAFDEFLWFTGESATDGSNGYWVLNQSAERPNAMLRIDWERADDEIGNIRYTWVRDLKDDDTADTFKDSYLEYGLQEGDYNVFYNVHAYDENLEAFSDVNIEWSRTNFNGRVRASAYFEDDAWHCWDSAGDDVDCP